VALTPGGSGSEEDDSYDTEGTDGSEGMEDGAASPGSGPASAPGAGERGCTPPPASRLTTGQLVVLCIVNFNEAVQGGVLFPFVPFAVESWLGLQKTPQDIGRWVGIIIGSFYFAQLLCVAAWGKASDVYGRRRTLLLGLIGTAASMAMFAVSRSYPWALAARFLTGAGNGNVAICKTYVGEMAGGDTKAQGRGFALLSFTWGLGAIVAPTLGGFLADPASKYPALFGDWPFFQAYPYALPCLASVCVSAVGFVLGFLFLPETQVFVDTQLEQKQQKEHAAAVELQQADEEGGGDDDDEEQDLLSPSKAKASRQGKAANTNSFRSSSSVGAQQPGGVVTARSVLSDAATMRTIFAYGLLCIGAILFDELLPVWSMTAPAQGGLGFSESQIGTTMLFAGVSQIISQVFVYPRFNARFGPLRLFRHAMWPMSLIALFPAVAWLRGTDLMWPALGAAIVFKTFLVTFAFTSIIIATNNAANGRGLGIVNGIAQSAASFLRCVGPAAGGALFSSSLSWESLGRYRPFCVYLVAGLCFFAGFVASYILPESVNIPPTYKRAVATITPDEPNVDSHKKRTPQRAGRAHIGTKAKGKLQDAA
jgi:MFS family permease